MLGSPPRAWGRRPSAPGSRPALRFTPTRVGKTRGHGRRRRALAVHPHVRGEHADATTFDFRGNGSPPRAWGRWTVPGVPWDSPGSPPRAWGRPGRELQPSPVRRFTPTRVGKTDGQTPRSEVPAVHPHARGEDELAEGFAGDHDGSPPRAWGRQTIGDREMSRVRFTPTRVGKTQPY